MQDRRFKELFDTIPSLDELYALGSEGLRAYVILVDADKDKKLSMLKQLIATLVRGLNSNPPAVVKKIAGLVCSFGITNLPSALSTAFHFKVITDVKFRRKKIVYYCLLLKFYPAFL